MHRVWNSLTEHSLLLVLGALIALFWANADPGGYRHFVEFALVEDAWIGHARIGDDGQIHRTLTFHYLVNDVLMALFFAVAGKEVWEAVALRNGALRGRKAMTPLIATAGGMLGPVAVYLGLAAAMGSTAYDALASGWAIPTATDIAFSYLVGRLVFGAGHPAVRFLLLLAIADDAAGLVILAVFYPSGELEPRFLLISLGAAVGVWLLANRLPRRMDRGKQHRPHSTWMRRRLGFWPYLIAACLSWHGFQAAGVHPALGLLPIVPAIPNADISFGVFAGAKARLRDLLDDIGRRLKTPVEVILFLFGLANAGVELSSMGAATWLVLAGLVVGKPLGILSMGWLAASPMKLGLPEGMRMSELFVLGCVASIGFTVSLFVASVAFDPGPVQDAAKMGALFSFGAALLSFIAGKACRVERREA